MSDAALRVEDFEQRTAKGIAASVGRMVSSNRLDTGARMPTVRALAADLGVSPATVSAAWQELIRAGVLVTRGKLGTFVRGAGAPTDEASRFFQLAHTRGGSELDLSLGTPDPRLLPDLGRALSAVNASAATASYFEPALLPALGEVLLESWPFVPESLTMVDGAMDAMDRVIAAVVRFGDHVLVDNPTFPPILDLLEKAGAVVHGVGLDDDGIDVAQLSLAVQTYRPVLVVLQPRGHNPRGCSMTKARAKAAAAALRSSEAIILEDDHAAYTSLSPAISMGEYFPHRTVLVRSFSKSHGPDLRLAAMGGAGEVVEKVIHRRLYGPAWSSRLLQSLLLSLLTDPTSVASVAKAAQIYAERRVACVNAFQQRGVIVEGRDGINLWTQVTDEHTALIALAVKGVNVAPGSPFSVDRRDHDHIRITCSTVAKDYDALAETVAAAARSATFTSFR